MHDPHESARQLVDADHVSYVTIEAYLIQLDQLAPHEPFAAIELNYPGDETAAYLLTLGQLRCLAEAIGGMLAAAAKT